VERSRARNDRLLRSGRGQTLGVVNLPFTPSVATASPSSRRRRGAFSAWMAAGPFTSPLAIICVIAAAACLTVTLLRLPTLLAATYRFGDAPELSFIARGLAAGHGPLNLPTQTSIDVLWFDELINGLPLRDFLEYWTGPLLAVASGLLLIRTAYIFSGKRVAAGVALMLAVLPPVVLWPLLFPDNHITSILGMVLLAWHLQLDLRAKRGRLRSALVGAVCGSLVMTDPQLLVVGVAPYVLTGLLLAWGRNRVAGRPILITLVWLAVGLSVTEAVSLVQGITVINLVPGSSLASNIAHGLPLALKSFGWILGGGWFGDGFPPHLILLVLPLAAFVAAVVEVAAFRAGRSLLRRRDHVEVTELAWQIYWVLSMVLLIAVFVLLGYGYTPVQGHYLVPCFFAVAALAPAVLARSSSSTRRRNPQRRFVATTAATLFVLYAAHTAYATTTIDPSNLNFRLAAPTGSDPLSVLEARGLHRGYAGYWEAYDLAWRSEGTISVWPVLGAPAACGGAPGGLCSYAFAPQGEYTSTTGGSFIVTPGGGQPCLPQTPSVAIFGKPAAVYHAGLYTISVYSYDVAQRFSRRLELFC
jgi:hypothetical protein